MPPKKQWLPLESNPEVITEFAGRLGLDTAAVAFHDVFGLDEELLAMVPQPVLAVLLLFPITKESEAADAQADAERAAAAAAAAAADGGGDAGEEEEAREEGEPPLGWASDAVLRQDGGHAMADAANAIFSASRAQHVAAQAPYYMKQTIGNACGTIAMLHALGNNQDRLAIAPGSFLARFFEATRALSPEQRGAFLESPPSDAPDIEQAHQAAGAQGSTAPPPADQDVDLHFIAFVEHKGKLYELDGRRSGPIAHGATSREALLGDVARVTKDFIARSNSLNFNLIALAPADAA